MSAGKGGKNRKKAKNFGVEEKRELVFKEEGQEYGQVLRMLGKRVPLNSVQGTGELRHSVSTGRSACALSAAA